MHDTDEDAAGPSRLDLQRQLMAQIERAVEAESRAELAEERLAEIRAERDALRDELASLRATTTWRVGNSLVRPVAALTGRRKRD